MIRLHIPSLPPSVNHAYYNLPRGGRVLTKEGKRYKAETAAHLTQTYPSVLARIAPNQPYSIVYILTIPTLLNNGYPDKAENKYKKLDASNRIKLLEDVLADVMGIDDSTSMNVLAAKQVGPHAATEIVIYGDEPDELDPITILLHAIRNA